MSWRTVVITKNCKLDYSLGYMVVRDVENTVKIHISEISVLIIDSTSVSLTSYLLNELIKSKVKVIFSDEKHNPASELTPYYGSHDSSLKLKNQTAWFVVSKNYEPFVFEKTVAVFENILDFNSYDKKLMTKSYPKLEQTANEMFYEDLSEIRQRLIEFGDKLCFEYDLDYSFNYDIPAIDILKLLSFGIRKDNANSMENIVLYMKLLKKYLGIKLFVTSGLWLYFTSAECDILNETLQAAGINVLNIENRLSEGMKNENESVYVIDNDLCEIVDNPS